MTVSRKPLFLALVTTLFLLTGNLCLRAASQPRTSPSTDQSDSGSTTKSKKKKKSDDATSNSSAQGKDMTEVDASEAGYRASEKH